MGKITTPAIFFSGGAAAVMSEPVRIVSYGMMFRKFLSSGAFIGVLGLYMNKGNDKA